MFRARSVPFLALGCLLLTAGANAQTSRFHSSDQGWTVVNFAGLSDDNYNVLGTFTPTHASTGGNPGGYIYMDDPSSGDFMFSAPSAYFGNKSGASHLSYDITHPIGAIDYQTTDVMLTGNGERLLWHSDPNIVPGPGWTGVDVSFSPSSNWLVGTTGGAEATAADFQNVLGNLDGLYIRGEYTDGDERAGLDNVKLCSSAVPENGALGMVGTVVVLGGTLLRGRRRRR